LYAALDDEQVGPQLKRTLSERFGCTARCALSDPATQFVGLAEMVRAARLPVSKVKSAVVPPTMLAVKLLTKDDFKAMAADKAKLNSRDVLVDGRVRLLFSSGQRGLELDEFHPADPRSFHRYSVNVPVVPASAGLLPATARALVDGPGIDVISGQPTFDAKSGQRVHTYRGRQEGYLLQRRKSRRYELVYLENGEVKERKKIKLPRNSSRPRIVAEHLLWIERNGEAYALFARKLTTERQLLEKKIRLGPMPTPRNHGPICQDQSRWVVLFGRRDQPRALAFFDGQQWSSPVVKGLSSTSSRSERVTAADQEKAPPSTTATARARAMKPAQEAALQDAAEFGVIGLLSTSSSALPDANPWTSGDRAQSSDTRRKQGRAKKRSKRKIFDRESTITQGLFEFRSRRYRPRLVRYPLTCRDGQAIITWREPKEDMQIIHQLRCSRSGCEKKTAELVGLNVKAWWLATTMGDRTLLVWRTRGGDLRMRLAPIDQLAHQTDELIMDSHEHGGPATEQLEVFVASQGVVFIFRDRGYYGLRIDENGLRTPLSW